jgi:hypothetical protein
MSLKTIKVNPIFLSGQGSSFSPKNKTRKEKPTGVSLSQSNSIKKKLITRIKNFQQGKDKQGKDQQGNDQQGNDPQGMAQEPINDAFSDSLQFLDNLARDKEEKKREKRNTTLKKKQELPNAYMHIATELPPELDWNTIMPKLQAIAQIAQPIQKPMQAQQAQMQVPQAQMQAPQAQMQAQPVQQHIEPIPQPWQAPPQPSYGNLKTGGTKPTYRTWLRTTQKQKPVVKPVLNILEDIEKPLVAEEKAEEEKTHTITIDTGKEEAPAPTIPTVSAALVAAPHAPTIPLVPAYMPSLKPKRKRITRTLKYKLGKHANGKVSVLIKNSQTRRKIQTEQALLKQKSILDIKNHLRSNNLLKAGSTAPSDVLRHLYEQSILAGQIENKAKDTLIHNYFNDEKK